MTPFVSNDLLQALKAVSLRAGLGIAGLGITGLGVVGLGAGFGALLAVAPAHADPGAFSGYAGRWSGNGTITIANAGTERIRCKGTYKVENGGNTLLQDLRCASDSYRFDLNSEVNSSGGNLSGSWTEASRNINGSISGRISGGQVTALVQTNGYAANFSISTRGSKQSVHITSKGDLREVNISLAKN
ncbi:hypothetical protein ACSVBT_01420 [Afipia sp. TerB]